MKYAMCLKKKMTGKRNNKETKENHITTAALEDETLDLLLPLANRVPPKKRSSQVPAIRDSGGLSVTHISQTRGQLITVSRRLFASD